MKFYLSFKSLYKNLSFTFLVIAFFFLAPIIYLGKLLFEPIFIIFCLLPVAVSLFLFFEYLNKELKRNSVIIDDEAIEIIVQNNDSVFFSNEDILGLTLFGGVSYFQKTEFSRNLRFLPFEIFHFAEIKFKDSSSLYLTSLTDVDLFYKLPKLPIFQDKVKYKKTRFPSIIWNKMEG